MLVKHTFKQGVDPDEIVISLSRLDLPYRYYQFCHLLQWPIKELDIKDVLGNRTP